MKTTHTVVNVSAVKHLSPFRYPGGKTWLVPTVMRWLSEMPVPPAALIEPFAGGGIVGLSALDQGIVDSVLFVERDPAVASVWRTILGRDNLWLRNALLAFDLTRENAQRSLASTPKSRRELAFQTVLRNRVQHGGIMAPGASLMLSGENGKGISSRWYPQTIAARILGIWKMRDRIQFVEGDAFDVMAKHMADKATAWFIDPPYTAGGKKAGSRLYLHAKIDHPRLFSMAAACTGPAMLTYDDSTEVDALAKQFGLVVGRVPMKGTHHNIIHELVITKSAHKDSASQRAAVANTFRTPARFEHQIQPSLFA